MNSENEPEAATVEPTAKAAKKPKAEKPAKAEAVDVPPCPPEDPLAGDKTPEVVAWWFKHHPEQAATKYAGRKFTRPE